MREKEKEAFSLRVENHVWPTTFAIAISRFKSKYTCFIIWLHIALHIAFIRINYFHDVVLQTKL